MDTETPQVVEMERELLGALILKEGKIIPQIASIISPDDFYSDVNKILYRIILNLHFRGIVPNLLLIIEEMEKLRDFKDNQKIFIEAALNLGEVAFTTAYAESQAKVIKEKSIRRQIIRFANRLQKDVADPVRTTDDILNRAESTLRELNNESVPPKIISEYDYFSQLITTEIASNKLYANRKTSFENIDDNQIFSPGLYVLGATPACGKTTFCWQLLSQLANNDENCIFCSYEMSALELFSKTLARELFRRNPHSSLTAADIRRGGYSPELEDLMIEFAGNKNLKGVNLLTLRDESIDELLRLIKPYCTDKNKSPVVCLDYLQIVPPSNDPRLNTDKARIDDIVHKLKTFQRETNTTFIVVSSFNRLNYFQQVAFESFKESGNIEYTADVVWAMQLNIVNEIKIGASISETRKKIEDAKKQQPRHIQLRCLKNRQGGNYDCAFKYFSAHDFFEPCSLEDFIVASTDTPAPEENKGKDYLR